MSVRTVVPVCVLAAAAAPACAELPGPVRAMIESAIRTDNAAAVAAVVKAAKETQPQDSAEIDAMKQKFDVLAARPLQLWKGEGEIGAFRATGNTENAGVAVGLKLDRSGVYWQHKLQFNADYQKTNRVVSREQYLASYSPRYTLSERFYVYGLAQYESDRFQGYASRYSLSPGFGYRVFDDSTLKLSFEGGPALRYTNYIDEPRTTNVSGFALVDFSWRPLKNLKLTQQANTYVESDNSTFTSTTALEVGMLKGLKTRLSYRYEHDTDPPDASRRTDTLSRFTLVYGF
jgi:putative salt-induced outer membrane protein